ncbi:winged helix-turn-helix domain-containing protein [Virgibacillus salexigens]|uniref:Helix-turn-helix domain protein n=1 Tax=Virgibacillus massiliensis TaxID=1462526 RepID=A0A024QI75_9BACI|nr:winged helix-turn-helix domain-containing protein [Virgibacillus massiliensis]CDQ41927.1 Helix-turn-helix domain protein [Virgibacillus massiliensis]
MPKTTNRVDRSQVYDEVYKILESAPGNEKEISASELADIFDVQAATMDYHLKKLVENGELLLSDKRGRYNRKIYKLPTDSSKNKSDDSTNFSSKMDQYKSMLQNKLKNKSFTSNLDKEKKEDKTTVEDESNDIENQVDYGTNKVVPIREEDEKQEESLDENYIDYYDNSNYNDDVSLDAKIENFLYQSRNVPTAEKLLNQQDREVLSVMNESIQQHIIYLKDLSEQLSTVQNKELIQQLIDERNDYLKEKDQMQNEIDILRNQLEHQKGNFDLDPKRIRLIQQNLFNVLDTYLDQPNHTLALGRKEFRKAMTTQINDAFRYILNLEK